MLPDAYAFAPSARGVRRLPALDTGNVQRVYPDCVPWPPDEHGRPAPGPLTIRVEVPMEDGRPFVTAAEIVRDSRGRRMLVCPWCERRRGWLCIRTDGLRRVTGRTAEGMNVLADAWPYALACRACHGLDYATHAYGSNRCRDLARGGRRFGFAMDAEGYAREELYERRTASMLARIAHRRAEAGQSVYPWLERSLDTVRRTVEAYPMPRPLGELPAPLAEHRRHG